MDSFRTDSFNIHVCEILEQAYEVPQVLFNVSVVSE